MKKKETWKFILQTLLSVLSAIAQRPERHRHRLRRGQLHRRLNAGGGGPFAPYPLKKANFRPLPGVSLCRQARKTVYLHAINS